jgi:hypothetical protein
MTEQSVAWRLANRAFPSVFQAWNPAENLKGEDPLDTAARHDLLFNGPEFFKLAWDHAYQGLATSFTPSSVKEGLEQRKSLLERNPNMILILEIRYRDAWGNALPKGYEEAWKKANRGEWRGFLPADHKWWKRGADGQIVKGWKEGGFLQLDFANPEYQEQVATQCEAAVKSGVVDGVMLDWWEDDADRLALVKAIRRRIGGDALVVVNSNDRPIPRTAAFVNGLFMECYRSKTSEDWRRITETLAWAEKNLRAPRVNCLETWYHKSRADDNLMRATTAISLVLSDGYCLFSDPNPLPTPDHLHDWYPFWERRLGKAQATGVTRPDGAMVREFDRGTAAYNPMGNQPVTLTFAETRCSRSTGKRARTHTLNPCDGDLFLKTTTSQPARGDGNPAPQP